MVSVCCVKARNQNPRRMKLALIRLILGYIIPTLRQAEPRDAPCRSHACVSSSRSTIADTQKPRAGLCASATRVHVRWNLVFFSSSLTTESRAEPVGFLGEYPRVTDDQLKLALGWMPRLRLPVFCAVHVSHISGSSAGVIPQAGPNQRIPSLPHRTVWGCSPVNNRQLGVCASSPGHDPLDMIP